MDKLEKYSSAITLSDMEIFVFPELMYSLVLANIMSPIIWRWREEDCFKKLNGKSSYKKLTRLKQFIMDNYEFNLDLETWGLTSQKTELERFKDFISPEDIASSNALFGYHGDEYYFDVDIRRHFGLDKYGSDIIPYWKTETIEAMDAFCHREGYTVGAGECVSFSALYIAAAYVVCEIPLDDMYMILTPLHSQNFIDISDGVITNNRRIVTKTMWFNGTAITNKAQRALANENVTIVAHNSGYVHTFYEDATINNASYEKFTQSLGKYLCGSISMLNIANFLRSYNKYQKHFQFCRHYHGHSMFVKAETMFHYEHGSRFRIADDTYDKLLNEVDQEDYSANKYVGRICCEQLRVYLEKHNFDILNDKDKKALAGYLEPYLDDSQDFVKDLEAFLLISPKLPDGEKKYIENSVIELPVGMSRLEIIDYLSSIRSKTVTADLAFYAYRDIASCDWQPFVTAALERSPVSLAFFEKHTIDEIYQALDSIDNVSIYDGTRLATPDEVMNFSRGDGLEKAFVLANVIKNKKPKQSFTLVVDNQNVTLKAHCDYQFTSVKNIQKTIEF